MDTRVTVAVEDYRSTCANGREKYLLQSPISPDRRPGRHVLVRQDQGEQKNEVAFKMPEELVKLDSAPKRTYAHGILLRPKNRKGDPIWLMESASKSLGGVSVQNRTHIAAVNLRTWESIRVALEDVCWIPKYRKIDCSEDDDELLTISGPLVKKYDARTYFLAVVQRLRVRDGILEAERAEVAEMIEQDTWKYQNLTALADGERRIKELFRRCLACVAPVTFLDVDTDEDDATQPSTEGLETDTGTEPDRAISLSSSPPDDILEDLSLSIIIDVSPVEGEDDPVMIQRHLDLERKVLTKLARPPEPIFPDGPPLGICNLGHRCPTPSSIFFEANMPTIENPYPKHHHIEDHDCVIGSAHELHCVFQYRKYGKDREVIDRRSCIIPPNVRHTCCNPNAWPKNKWLFRPPSNMMDVGEGEVVVRQGYRGSFSVVGDRESDFSDLPVAVQDIAFDPSRDLDELGRRLFGYREKVGMMEEATKWINSFCDSVSSNCERPVHARQQQQPQPQQTTIQGRGLGVPGSCAPGPSSCPLTNDPWNAQTGPDHRLGSASRPIVLDDDQEDDDIQEEQELEAFGDRHFHGDEDEYFYDTTNQGIGEKMHMDG
ncbi:hypothetical protein VP1G_09076 [Cytospora mali]|uniref:Uncharacterized protein n=1 Tax=Cytospora mali TaxID=578113 RepID=A0A194VDE8_CYTMA|nr:hypothetical protein VP1G_09076 [Valsa mali var. pyri (nom. inval.)]